MSKFTIRGAMELAIALVLFFLSRGLLYVAGSAALLFSGFGYREECREYDFRAFRGATLFATNP